MRDFSLSGILVAVGLALAAGCSGCKSSSEEGRSPIPFASSEPTSCTVTFYAGGTEVGKWDSDRYSSGDAKLYFYVQGSTEPHVVTGTYVLEPKVNASVDPTAEAAARAKAKHKVSLYNDGVLVRTFLVERYSAGDGKLYLYPEVGKPATIISGTFVVEPVQTSSTGLSAPLYTVSLYSGGRAVRVWEVTRYTPASGKLYLYVSGLKDAIVISGSFLVTPK